MGCTCSDSVEEKENQRKDKVNPQTIVVKKNDQQLDQKENQNKKEKEEVTVQKRDIQIVGPLLKLPEDNIEIVTFTEKTMDLKK